MGQPAARVTDMHVCPMQTPGTPPIPHVGGPITGPGAATVLIANMPAAVVGDMCTCTGPPDSIIKGSMGVFICGKPAARMGDSTAHGGTIVKGEPRVLIGDVGGGGGVVMINSSMIKELDISFELSQLIRFKKAASSGASFCEVSEKENSEKKDGDIIEDLPNEEEGGILITSKNMSGAK